MDKWRIIDYFKIANTTFGFLQSLTIKAGLFSFATKNTSILWVFKRDGIAKFRILGIKEWIKKRDFISLSGLSKRNYWENWSYEKFANYKECSILKLIKRSYLERRLVEGQ